MRKTFHLLCWGAFALLQAFPTHAQVWTEPLPIMDLAGAGDLLVAATQGGLVVWERSRSSPSQVVTTPHGLPTQVLLTARLHPLQNELMVTTTNGAARGWLTGSWSTVGALPGENGSPYYASLVLPKGGWVLGGERGKLIAWHGTQVDSMNVPTHTGRVIALAFMPQWLPDGVGGGLWQSEALPSGLVVVLDNDGVWLLLHSAKPEWRRLDTGDNLPSNLILDAVVDAQGALWMASGQGIARMRLPGVIETFPLDTILSQRANALFVAPSGNLYIGLPSGMARVDPATDPPISERTQWTDRPVTSIAWNDDGLWWTDGTAIRSSSGAELAVPLSVADGHGLAVAAHAETMWFGHPSGRLSRFAGGEWTRFGSADGLPYSDINSLTVFNGLLHVGTSHGVYFEDSCESNSRFRALGSGPSGIVRSLAVRDGVLLAGSSEGLWEYGDSAWRPLPLWPGAREVQSLVAADVLWASAGEAGVAFHNQHGWHPVAVDSELCSRFFGAVTARLTRQINTGTDCGVALWDGGVLQGVAGGPAEFVHAVQWWGNALAVGTDSGLWIRHASGEWVWLGIFDGLAGTKIRAIAPGREGSLWVATTRGIASLPELHQNCQPRGHAVRPHHIVRTSTIVQDAKQIRFDLPNTSGAWRARIYDIRGCLVRSLSGHPGQQVLSWGGRDEIGRNVANGVYFVRIESGRTTQIQRFVWLR